MDYDREKARAGLIRELRGDNITLKNENTLLRSDLSQAKREIQLLRARVAKLVDQSIDLEQRLGENA